MLRLQYRETGRKLDIRRMSVWLGEETAYTPEDARATMHTLTGALQETFGPDAFPHATPAQTGLELWKPTVHWMDYQPLPAEMQRLIRATSGQGRIELCPPAQHTLPGFYQGRG